MINTASDQNSLSKTLHEHTQSIHAQMKSHPFFLLLREGKLSPESYVQYLADLHEVYAVLEEEMEKKLPPETQSMIYLDLCRTAYLQKDIESFDPVRRAPSHAAKNYVRHLQVISRSAPLFLLAHAYFRYLGDLTEGRLMQKHINALFPGNHGAFYDFEKLLGPNAIGAKVVKFKNQWKKSFDALPLNHAQREQMVEEAMRGFEYTRQILDAALVNIREFT